MRGDVPNSPGCGAVNAAVLNSIIGVLLSTSKIRNLAGNNVWTGSLSGPRIRRAGVGDF